jgi:thymidylate synthase (FAD)
MTEVNKRKDVLDKGYVILHDTLGTDLTPVNSARVSYNKKKDELDEKDIGLLKFLVRDDHTSPFRHAMLQFEVYAPLMVARQWWKYQIGSSHQEGTGDTMVAWNESSRRYITEEPTFYIPQPNEWRKKPANSKQGSGENFTPEELGLAYTAELEKFIQHSEAIYERALGIGIAPEQARLFLPAYGMYVRWYWTASLQSVLHFVAQRIKEDAQYEIQAYAKEVLALVEQQFPNVVKVYKEQGKL